jgi:hypothetical protein
MSRRKRILAAVFVALVVALVVFFKSRVPAGATAADGRRCTLEKITHGTEHSFTTGKLWVRVLKPVLGTRWAAQRGFSVRKSTRIDFDVAAESVLPQSKTTP